MADTEAKGRMHRLRPLAGPRETRVEQDDQGRPATVLFEGEMRSVAAVQDRWRIDDEWWREHEISRMYWALQLDGGRVITVYRDLVGGDWYEQRY